MLRHLTISNIALIDKLSLDFEEGFSALTGETGAGKSILIEAVGLALGERAYRESIRTGAQKGAVEALFTVKEGTPAAEYLLDQELYDGEEVVLYRELYASGKSVCRINGTLVSAAELKTVGDMLVDMHGQHAHQSLLNEKTHLGLLDAFADSDGDGLLTRMREERRTALEARNAREKLQNSLKERARRLDVIAYELKEIDGADLQPGEEDQLELKKKQLQNFAAIEENLQAAYDALYEEQGALGQIAEAKRCLAALGEYGEEYRAAAQQTEEAYYSLEDVSYTLRDALNGLSFDPDALTEIESRLFQIEQLKRKYGADIEEILTYADALRAEQTELLGGEDRMAELSQAERAAVAAFTADGFFRRGSRQERAALLGNRDTGGAGNIVQLRNQGNADRFREVFAVGAHLDVHRGGKVGRIGCERDGFVAAGGLPVTVGKHHHVELAAVGAERKHIHVGHDAQVRFLVAGGRQGGCDEQGGKKQESFHIANISVFFHTFAQITTKNVRKAATIIIPLVLLALLAAQFTACEKYVLPEVNVSADTLWFGAAADSQRLTVWTNVITTAEPDDADGWIWAEPYWFDADCTLVVYVRENYDPVQRTGTLPIKSEAILRNVTVIQEGNPNPPEPEL